LKPLHALALDRAIAIAVDSNAGRLEREVEPYAA
jgi:hypothetical protein